MTYIYKYVWLCCSLITTCKRLWWWWWCCCCITTAAYMFTHSKHWIADEKSMRDRGNCARSNDNRSFDMQPTDLQSEWISYKYSAGILSYRYRSTHKWTHVNIYIYMYVTEHMRNSEIETETEAEIEWLSKKCPAIGIACGREREWVQRFYCVQFFSCFSLMPFLFNLLDNFRHVCQRPKKWIKYAECVE